MMGLNQVNSIDSGWRYLGNLSDRRLPVSGMI